MQDNLEDTRAQKEVCRQFMKISVHPVQSAQCSPRYQGSESKDPTGFDYTRHSAETESEREPTERVWDGATMTRQTELWGACGRCCTDSNILRPQTDSRLLCQNDHKHLKVNVCLIWIFVCWAGRENPGSSLFIYLVLWKGTHVRLCGCDRK